MKRSIKLILSVPILALALGCGDAWNDDAAEDYKIRQGVCDTTYLPTILTPQDGTGLCIADSFTWESTSIPTGYQIQVGLDADFNDMLAAYDQAGSSLSVSLIQGALLDRYLADSTSVSPDE